MPGLRRCRSAESLADLRHDNVDAPACHDRGTGSASHPDRSQDRGSERRRTPPTISPSTGVFALGPRLRWSAAGFRLRAVGKPAPGTAPREHGQPVGVTWNTMDTTSRDRIGSSNTLAVASSRSGSLTPAVPESPDHSGHRVTAAHGWADGRQTGKPASMPRAHRREDPWLAPTRTASPTPSTQRTSG